MGTHYYVEMVLFEILIQGFIDHSQTMISWFIQVVFVVRNSEYPNQDTKHIVNYFINVQDMQS